VEAWQDGELVGGLYGVALRGLFAGESMFSRRRDASKVALASLVDHLREKGFFLLDVQYMTEHLRRFGAVEISAAAYRQRLAVAMTLPVIF
jgi:leucyl/phenylalanyl-tRNA--protein transferase